MNDAIDHQTRVVAAEELPNGRDLGLPPDQRRTLHRQVIRSGVETAQGREVGEESRMEQLKDALGADQVPKTMLAQ